MDGSFAYRGRRIRTLAATLVGLVALVAAIGVGSAQAGPPAKVAERRCLDAGGQFLWEATQYSCTGLASSEVMSSASRQCLNTYKGYAFSWWRDPATGQWSYICSFPQ